MICCFEVTTHPIGALTPINIGLVTAYRMPEMRGIVLRSVHPVREQGDNEADSVHCEQLRFEKNNLSPVIRLGDHAQFVEACRLYIGHNSCH